jgi:hypothetical protein
MARELLLAPCSCQLCPASRLSILPFGYTKHGRPGRPADLPEMDHAQCFSLQLEAPRKVSSLAVLRTCQVATASITWRYRIWKLRRRCSGPNYTVAMLRAGYKTRSIALDPAHSILRIASFHIHFEDTQSNEDHFLLPRCHRRPGFCCTS